VAFKLAQQEEFRTRQERTLDGAQLIARRLNQPDVAEAMIALVSGGTDVHLVLVDLRDCPIDGQQAETRLDKIGITVNRNAVPFDPRPPMVSSGIRIGTAGSGHTRFRARRVHRGRRHHRPDPAALVQWRSGNKVVATRRAAHHGHPLYGGERRLAVMCQRPHRRDWTCLAESTRASACRTSSLEW
jgi:hypothetical protein